jgi:CBS domain containing-hemolysin-like protein
MIGDPSSLDALRERAARQAAERIVPAVLKFRRVFRPRIWLGKKLLRLALAVMGATMETQI